MTTLDFRSRFRGDEVPLDPAAFVNESLPALLGANGEDAGRAATRLRLAPLTFCVKDEQFTLAPENERLSVTRGGAKNALVAALEPAAFSDLVQDISSTFGLQMMGRAEITKGTVDAFVAWEPVLRSLLDGRPVYEPGSIGFDDLSGSPLNLQRTFTLDDPPEEIGHFLSEAGFLHIEGVFTEAEMAEVSTELDDAIACAERDDGASWWALTQDGEWYPSRILGFNQKSPALRALLQSERFAALGTFTDDHYVQRDPNSGDSAEALLKKIGVIEGISDVSWHKDCSMGDHSRDCCGLIVGISVTSSGYENGELGVVAGSHRANIAQLGIEGIDLPRMPLATHAGDLTVHCSCTLHMSRPPISGERRVIYTGFGLAPRPGDRVVSLSQEQIRNDRAALNEKVRDHQRDRTLSPSTASFDL
jgi:hypothetical protein